MMRTGTGRPDRRSQENRQASRHHKGRPPYQDDLRAATDPLRQPSTRARFGRECVCDVNG